MTIAKDPMQPGTNERAEVCGPLAAVTMASGAPDRMRRLLQGALNLTPRFERVEGAAARALAEHWGVAPSDSIDLTLYTRPEVDDAVTLRVLHVAEATAVARPRLDCRYVGALGVGFAIRGLRARHAIVEQSGFGSTAGVTFMPFPRADGTTYEVGESHWIGPDEFMVLGVDRSDMPPIGSIDAALGMGGPNYSSALVSDAGRTGAFLDEVLGLELRREFTFEADGPDGGMGLPAGTRVHFQQWFAPKARSGYLVIMQLLEHGLPPPQPLGLRSRGIGLWSFKTRDVEAVQQRALHRGATVSRAPASLAVPGSGQVTALMLATPDGFPIEVFS